MEILVKNTQYQNKHAWFFEVPEFELYVGEEVATPKWVKPDQTLCLSTGLKEFPIRFIDRSNIVSINGKKYKHVVVSKPTLIKKTVKGSKGQEYTVINDNGKWSCTCMGFQFRGKCKHTQ